MTKSTTKIPISSIIFEEDIYPRKGIDHKRVGIFAENIRDGFKFEPIEVEPCPDRPGKYRLLDGVHRWSAYKKNPTLTSSDIGKAIGRARRTVDTYITDLRAATQMGLDIKMFCMNHLGIPQDRMAKRLGVKQVLIHNHLLKMPVLANSINTDLSRGFTVSQVAEKHACPVGPEDRTGDWTEPMVWSQALKDKEDLERFKELGWGLRTWDQWEWNDCSPREIFTP